MIKSHLKIVETIINRDFKGKAAEHGQCKYLTEDGRKCVAGLFIPDGHEAQSYDGSVRELNQEHGLQDHFPLSTIGMVEWQFYHDGLDDYELDTEAQKKRLIERYKELEADCINLEFKGME